MTYPRASEGPTEQRVHQSIKHPWVGQLHHAVSMMRALASAGAPWATQAVVEWLTSVQLELLRSGRSNRLVEQLSQKAVQDVSSGGQQSNGNGSQGLVEQV